jgi:hypothetical protein
MANLPVKLVEPPVSIPNPKLQLAGFYTRLAIVLAILTAVAAVLAGKFSDTAMLIAVLVVGCTLVFAFTCGVFMARYAARGVERQLEEFRCGAYLAVWHCSEEEWRNFAEAEYRRISKEEGQIGLVLVGVWAGIVGVIGGIAGFALQEDLGWFAGVIGIVLGVLLGAGAGYINHLATSPISAAKRRYRNAILGGGPIYIGTSGVYTNGEYRGWGDVWGNLSAATVVDGKPAYLHVILERAQANPNMGVSAGTQDEVFFALSGTSTTAQTDVCIPVPAGHEDEARKIAKQLMHARGKLKSH